MINFHLRNDAMGLLSASKIKYLYEWMNWYFIAIPPLKDVFRTTSSGIR